MKTLGRLALFRFDLPKEEIFRLLCSLRDQLRKTLNELVWVCEVVDDDANVSEIGGNAATAARYKDEWLVLCLSVANLVHDVRIRVRKIGDKQGSVTNSLTDRLGNVRGCKIYNRISSHRRNVGPGGGSADKLIACLCAPGSYSNYHPTRRGAAAVKAI
jgi:hypothetical protein